MRKELEDRLINFAGSVIQMKGSLEPGEITDNLFGQLTRSATSAALNYGEAQGAESRIASAGLYRGNKSEIDQAMEECNQLVAIFHKIALTLKNQK
jgi:hypothetical protein